MKKKISIAFGIICFAVCMLSAPKANALCQYNHDDECNPTGGWAMCPAELCSGRAL